VRVPDVLLEHRLGSLRAAKFLWIRGFVTNHSALRRYYISRNRIVLWRRYAAQRPEWVWNDIRDYFRELLLIMVCEQKRWAKLRLTACGWRDGICGRMGPFESRYPCAR
jgi:rhamnosyltransferase